MREEQKKLAEALADYLEINIDDISIIYDCEEDDIETVFQNDLTEEEYKISTSSDVKDYIEDVLVPEKITEIENILSKNNILNFIEIDNYMIKEEILDNLEEYMECYGERIHFNFNGESYLIFKV